MKRQFIPERGQALIIVVFAIVGLVGIVGLAVDGGIAFSDRRHAQNAADTAALAGAMGIINPIIDPDTGVEMSAYDSMQYLARERADSNGYFGDLVRSQVEVYLCSDVDASCEEPYTGDPDYVQVIITSHVATFFARVVGIPQVHNRVQAVALANPEVKGDLYDGAGIVSLNPDCPENGSFIVNGGAHINILGGGILTNSNDACAFKCGVTCPDPTKCSLYICNEVAEDGVTCLEEGTITSATADGTSGGYTYVGQCEVVKEAVDDPGGKEQYPYPPELPELTEPEWECNPTNLGTASVMTYPDLITGELASYSRLTPGYYGEFPPKKLQSHLYMEPGIYCVDSIFKLTEHNLQVYGKDVLIWVRSNNGFTINGAAIRLLADQTGEYVGEDYAGYVIIVEPDYAAAVTACNIEGNAYNHYEGAIYGPHCDIKVTGNESTPPDGIDSQIIGYNVTLIGNADLTINYDSDKNPDVVQSSELGLTR